MSDVREDRISGLPDELLHNILVRLGSARAAARTSVLSRRWRPIWAHLPVLRLDGDEESLPGLSFVDAVDAALGAYSAPTLERLRINIPDDCRRLIPSHRLVPWLRFASQRVVGTLDLSVPRNLPSFINPESYGEEEASQLEFPARAAVKKVTLSLEGSWRLNMVGVFGVLTELDIRLARMEGSELTALVCKQCPILRFLVIYVSLIAGSDVSLHSDSLCTLHLHIRHIQRLDIVAPNLEVITVSPTPDAIRVTAPKLARIIWRGWAYDHHQHQFVDIGRRLQLLNISRGYSALSLMQHFTEVHELNVQIPITNGITGYERFLSETNKLPKCEILKIILAQNHHGLVPSMLHILRRCSSTRQLSVKVLNSGDSSQRYSCPSACPCRLAESFKIDDIALSSLEQAEINSFTVSPEEMQFVEQLLRCNAAILKKLVFSCTADPALLTKEICNKVRSMCPLNLEVEFYVMSKGRLVRFD